LRLRSAVARPTWLSPIAIMEMPMTPAIMYIATEPLPTENTSTIAADPMPIGRNMAADR
jgi:hypothetical protein